MIELFSNLIGHLSFCLGQLERTVAFNWENERALDFAFVGAWHDYVASFEDRLFASDWGLEGDWLDWKEVCLVYYDVRRIAEFSLSFLKQIKTYHAANSIWIQFFPVFLSDRQGDLQRNWLVICNWVFFFEGKQIFGIHWPSSLNRLKYTWDGSFSFSLRWHPPAVISFSHFPMTTWFFCSSSLTISTGLFEKIVSLYGKTLYSPSEEGIMMKGPSVGFHLKKSAEHSSLA